MSAKLLPQGFVVLFGHIGTEGMTLLKSPSVSSLFKQRQSPDLKALLINKMARVGSSRGKIIRFSANARHWMLGGHGDSTPTFAGADSEGVGTAAGDSKVEAKAEAPMAKDSGYKWANSSAVSWEEEEA